MKFNALVTLVSTVLFSCAAHAETPAVHLCKAYVQGRIDVLDAQMHKGDTKGQGRQLLKRRDRLREQIKACDKNPDAYKKNL
ncbi:MAG TPA: hypothetical protein VN645_02235 [Steroidobacteraceae bacterium]|nr:hypothetical protein [Steroidobacteraceae bacterium]